MLVVVVRGGGGWVWGGERGVEGMAGMVFVCRCGREWVVVE